MKILHVTNGVEWSGGLEQMTLLIAWLQKRGHKNLLACPPDSRLMEKFSGSDIPLHPLKMFQDYDLIAAWRLRRMIEEQAPDIVHAHHAIAHAICLLSLTGLKTPRLVISRRVSFPPRRNPFSVWKYRSHAISKFIVVSQSVKDILIQGGVDPAKIEVIYSAMNPERFAPRESNMDLRRELRVPDGWSIVGKIANFSRWKGQQVFLEAIPKCLPVNPKIVFILAGKGTESLADSAERLGINNSVRLLGFRKDIPDLISILDLSVNSAIEGEGLSGAVRESLAMGVPVIASDVAGNREIVRDGETGWLVPVGNPGVLSEKILTALKNPAEGNAMAQKGREWVMKHATVEIMAGRHEELYRSLVEKNLDSRLRGNDG